MFRLMAALVLLMALPACAARYQPAGPVCCDAVLALEGLGNDGAQAFTATMRDGMTLHGHVWPAKETEAVILALHGFGDYSLAFDEAATWWQARGVTLYAPDQRGFGNSAEYGIWAEADTYAADAAELLSLLRKRHSGKPVYGLGMSMGGAIITVAAGQGAAYDGLVLVAPAVLDKEVLPLYQRLALWVAVNLFPAAEPSGSNVNRQPTDNIEMLRQMSKDPLYYRRSRLDMVAGLIDVMDLAMTTGGQKELPPLLLLSGAKDELVEPAMTTDFLKRLEANPAMQDRVTRIHYDQGWHMLLRDKQRKRVWQDILEHVRQ